MPFNTKASPSPEASVMSSHAVLNGVDDAIRARLESYRAQKLTRLQKLLVRFPADLREIRLTVSQHRRDSQASRFEVRGVIHLPTGTLAAGADEEDPQTAVDRVADTLVGEVKRHRSARHARLHL
jgi:ribosome-associated translation inhibitor RaiA